MSTRIDRRFAALKEEGRAALVTFIMAGDPDYDTSLAIAKALPKAGADIIELGMPFTDPMADGPANASLPMPRQPASTGSSSSTCRPRKMRSFACRP